MKRLPAPLAMFLAGLAGVLAFAPFHVFPLGFVCLALLFHAWRRAADGRTAFVAGFAWGLGLFLGGVSWIYVSMHDIGGMPAPVAALMTLLFCAYLALYPALAGWVFVRFRRDMGGKCRDVLLLAAAWTLAEILRGYVATGFPWLAQGYAQGPGSPLAGYAALAGVYGVTFLVAVVAACLTYAGPGFRLGGWKFLLPAAAVLAVGSGLRMMHWTSPVGEPFKVSLLQGNVEQSLKWDPQHLAHSMDTYAQLARAHPAPLIVLPETAIPLMFNEIPKDYLKSLAGPAHSHLLLGSAIVVFDSGRPAGYANGGVLVTPELNAGANFKRHLVPFGEFVPTGFRWFTDMMRIPMADFSSGPGEQRPLILGDQAIAVNICYEDLFGEELIAAVPAASVLVNLSNTAWFGHSLAQDQHLQIAQMRAMETGRMMLRSTNTGMTAAVNADGNVAAVLPAFTRDGLVVEAQGYGGLTPYVILGNVPIMVLVVVILGWSWRQSRRGPDQSLL